MPATALTVKRIPNAYSRSPNAMTWAVIEPGTYCDFVLESGFSTKRDALAWIDRKNAAEAASLARIDATMSPGEEE